MTKLRVFLADDHLLFRTGLRMLIDAQPDMEVIGEAADGDTAARHIVDFSPDVAVLDISMPGVDGIEATERIRAERPNVRVLALTAYRDGASARQMLAAGAAGFLTKLAGADDLVRAIRAVATDERLVDPSVVPPSAPPPRREDGSPPPSSVISDREIDVLRWIARGYTVQGVAAELGLGVHTVEMLKSRGMEKLGLKTRASLVRYATRSGWLTEK